MDYRARFEALITAAADGIIVVDGAGLLQVYNAACEQIFGYAAREVVGRNISMLLPADYQEKYTAYLETSRLTGRERTFGPSLMIAGQRKDGSTFPMHVSVGEGESPEGNILVAIVRDMTDRQNSERRAQELQQELLHVSRLSAMGEMSSALAHEVNQPLAAINNYVRAATRYMAGQNDPMSLKVRELLDKALAQTTRAGQVIRRLRDFIEKGETDRAVEDLNLVVDEAMGLALLGVAEAGVRANIVLDSSRPRVLIDKIQIQQVVLNLVRNSIEAMQETDTRDLTVLTCIDGDYAKVTVTDTGPGLQPHVAARLFEPFLTTKSAGMGIGLSICKTIVEGHSGRLWATPNLEAGVSFHLNMPLAV